MKQDREREHGADAITDDKRPDAGPTEGKADGGEGPTIKQLGDEPTGEREITRQDRVGHLLDDVEGDHRRVGADDRSGLGGVEEGCDDGSGEQQRRPDEDADHAGGGEDSAGSLMDAISLVDERVGQAKGADDREDVRAQYADAEDPRTLGRRAFPQARR